MTFWTFLFLLAVLGCFGIAQLLKLMNSDSRAGELARAFAWAVIKRISGRKDTAAQPGNEEVSH